MNPGITNEFGLRQLQTLFLRKSTCHSLLVVLRVSPAKHQPARDGTHGVVSARAYTDDSAPDTAKQRVVSRSEAGRWCAETKLASRCDSKIDNDKTDKNQEAREDDNKRLRDASVENTAVYTQAHI